VPAQSSASQTLSRGLSILDLLADASRAFTIAEVATGIGVHRSVAYRLVRTLEDHGLIVRDAAGSLLIGPHVATLARGIAADLQTSAQPVLRSLADELGMTAFLVVLDRDECVTLTTVEPLHTLASIAQRPGSRHSVLVGAPGVAVQTLLDADARTARGLDAAEAPEVAAARARGWATTHGEVIPGVTAVAAPVRGAVPAALAVLFVGESADDGVGSRVRDAAAALSRAIR
jgi:DNA-binding IclR family transcriptional regulator